MCFPLILGALLAIRERFLCFWVDFFLSKTENPKWRMIMEKRTMGSFIAALRRANGMTQRELAERLNVSDKSVSRWECDDGYPDLSLIPVIAEIFGVTADELLRGE